MKYDKFDIKNSCENIDELSNEEVAKAIRGLDYWDPDLIRELIWRANKIEPGILECYVQEEDNFERIVEKAADILNVEIY